MTAQIKTIINSLTLNVTPEYMRKTLVSSFRMLSLILTIYNGTIIVICAFVKCKPFHYHREISKAFFTIQLPFKN